VSEVAAAVSGALVEASASRVFEWRRDEQADLRARRRHHAKVLLKRLKRVRLLLSRAEVERSPSPWVRAVLKSYRALDAAGASLPKELRRIKGSLRDAVGTATGMGLVDLMPAREPQLAPYDRMWSQYAEEYVDLVIFRLQEWHNTWSNRRADRVTLPTFNTWLADTSRYRSGGPPIP
jgi:hypothetical protein